MDVSVIIVNYNTRKLTLNCIGSVYGSETAYSYEVILVDNASTDGTVQSVKALFPEVRIIENGENVGFGRANNQAAAVAAGRYLYILNSDTEIEKNVLEKVVSYGDSNPHVGIIGTKAVYPGGQIYCNFYKFPTLLSEFIFFTISIIKSKDWFLFQLNKYRNYPVNEPFEVDVITGCSLFVKRIVYEKTGLFNDKFFMYYEDGEFCYRVKNIGYKSIYLPTSQIKHIHRGSAKDNPDDFKVLVLCFKSALTYFSYIKNGLCAQLFKMACYFTWMNELCILKSVLVFSKKDKIRAKINMLQALLNE